MKRCGERNACTLAVPEDHDLSGLEAAFLDEDVIDHVFGAQLGGCVEGGTVGVDSPGRRVENQIIAPVSAGFRDRDWHWSLQRQGERRRQF